MSLIEIDRLAKSRGDGFALGPISLTLRSGEILGVMGPNGAGKTTLLRLIWGFLRPDGGELSVLGLKPHLDQIRMRRRAGFVGDSTRFYDWMTAEQHLSFVAGFYPTFDHHRAAELADRLALPLKTQVRKLSEGGRVKLALIGALAHRPGLLILDEPTSGLDPLVRTELLGVLRQMAETGVGIVLSSHLSGDLDRIADSILMLDRGEMIEYGPAPALRRKYGNSLLEDVFFNAIERVSGPRAPHSA
jgi:ABC-2 type transport system ATP-binding protein